MRMSGRNRISTGVLEVERVRPAEVLAAMLEERSSAKLEAFFRAYGAPEAAAMALLLATSPKTYQARHTTLI